MAWKTALGDIASVAQILSLLPLVLLAFEARRHIQAQKELDGLVTMLQETRPGLWVGLPGDHAGIALGLKCGILRGRYDHGRLMVCIAHDGPVVRPEVQLR